jgi:uncharacterized protein
MDQQAAAPDILTQLPPELGPESDTLPQSPSEVVESYDDNGVLIQKATYVDGVMDGELLAFNSQGTVIKKFFYRQGKLHGEALIYNDDGKLAQRLTYEDGILEGPFQIYTNDVLVVEIPYAKGVREGVGSIFALNGRIQSQSTFQADKENGARTIYNPELGYVVRTETLVDGVIEGQSVTFYPGGAIMMQQNFVKGLPDGRSVQFYNTGTIQQISIYDNGVLTAPPQQFDLTGKAI